MNQSSDNDEQDTSDKQEEDLVTNCNANCNDTKNRKKKKKRKKSENEKSRNQQHNVQYDEDEIERSVWEVNKLLGEPLPSCSNQVLEPQWVDKKSKEDILIVQHKHLNPYNELKRIFGSKTVQAERRYLSIVIYIYMCICIIFKLLSEGNFILVAKEKQEAVLDT